MEAHVEDGCDERMIELCHGADHTLQSLLKRTFSTRGEQFIDPFEGLDRHRPPSLEMLRAPDRADTTSTNPIETNIMLIKTSTARELCRLRF